MNWKLVITLSAAVAGALMAAKRRQKTESDAALWAEATDPVARSGPA